MLQKQMIELAAQLTGIENIMAITLHDKDATVYTSDRERHHIKDWVSLCKTVRR